MTPLARTKAHLEKFGWSVGIVERWLSFGGKGGIRKDLFEVGDLVALYVGDYYRGIWLLQVTSGSNHASRANKIRALILAPDAMKLVRKDGDEEKARAVTAVVCEQLRQHPLNVWLSLGGRIAVVSWSKHGQRGKRKLWVPRFEELDVLNTADVLNAALGVNVLNAALGVKP